MQFLNSVQKTALFLFFFSINFEMWIPITMLQTFSLSRITAIIYFISVAPQLFQFVRIDNLNSVLFPVWIFFSLLTAMSLINVNEVHPAFFDTTIFLNIVLFWIIINHVRKDYLILEKAMLFFALGSIVLATLFFAGIGIEYKEGRLSMFGDNQNILGLRMSISSIILITAAIQNRLRLGWYRYLFFFPIPFMLFFLAETGSRVAFISFVLASITGIILFKASNIRNKITFMIVGVISLSLILILLLKSEKLAVRILETSQTGDLGGREYIWTNIFPLIKQNPIFGIGKTGYLEYVMGILGSPTSPHNVFLEVLCYTGSIGLAIYLIFIYMVFIRGYRSYKNYGWLLPVLLIIPVMGMFMSGQILDSKIGWMIFAFIVGNSAMRYRDDKMS